MMTNYDYLLNILRDITGVEIDENTYVTAAELIEQIAENCGGGGGGTILPEWSGWEDVVDDYTPIEGEPFYLRSVDDNNLLDFTVTDYKLPRYADCLYYSTNGIDWDFATNLTTVTLNKNEKIYFKNIGTALSSTQDSGLVPSSKGIAIGGDVHLLFTTNEDNSVNYNHAFYGKSPTDDGLYKLYKIDQYTKFGKCTNISNMFRNNRYFKYASDNLDMDVQSGSISQMFTYCTYLENIPYFSTANVTGSAYRFAENCERIKYVPTLDFKGVTSMERAFYNVGANNDYTPISINLENAQPTMLQQCFRNASNVQEINGLNTANCTNFGHSFDGCGNNMEIPSLTVDFSSLENANGDEYRGANWAFASSGIKELTIENMKEGLTDIGSHIFFNSKITQINGDLSNFSTIENMSAWFYECNSLQTYPTTLNTSKNKKFDSFIRGCRNLDCSTLPKSMDVSNGETFLYMFEATGEYTGKMITAPLLNITPKEEGIEFDGMFAWQTNLVTIPLLNLSNPKYEWSYSSMFDGCSALANITFEGTIDANLTIPSSNLTYATVLSTLQAANASVKEGSFTLNFGGSTVTDENNEISTLIDSLTSKGWSITNLIIN